MKTAVVLVTYNRLKCLKIAISKYEEQSFLPNIIIVVDNASTDGTYEYLDEWKNEESLISKHVIHNNVNTGGAGGFYTGLKYSMQFDYDFVFLADDDAFVEKDTFRSLFSCNKIFTQDVVAACTSVINNGKLEISHRCRLKNNFFVPSLSWVPEWEYKKDIFYLDIVTFVGAAIKKSTIDKIGFPIKDYFIYYDDTEYFMRISKLGKVVCVPNSRIIHNTDGKLSINSWKGYYDTRNWLDAIYRHYNKFSFICSSVYAYLRRCSILSKLLRSRSSEFNAMCKIAIKDAINHKLGINEKYHP